MIKACAAPPLYEHMPTWSYMIQSLDSRLMHHRCNDADMVQVKVAIIPGNGAGNVMRCNFYGWLKEKLHHPPGCVVALRNMPDPLYARESIWLPFMEKDLGCDASTILVGHSSGAAAAMRYAETHDVGGIVLVSAYTTDQGDPTEAASGYFSRPWDWEAIKRHTRVGIAQFASEDDPFLPMSEQLEVAEGLGAQLHKFDDRGHFQDEEQDEILAVTTAMAKQLQAALP